MYRTVDEDREDLGDAKIKMIAKISFRVSSTLADDSIVDCLFRFQLIIVEFPGTSPNYI